MWILWNLTLKSQPTGFSDYMLKAYKERIDVLRGRSGATFRRRRRRDRPYIKRSKRSDSIFQMVSLTNISRL